MLDVLRQAHPGVFAFFVDRERWRGKAGLPEGTNRDGDIFLSTLDRVMNRCAAGRTEVERNLAARVAYTYVLLRLPFDRYALSTKARLSTKDAPGSTLTGKTVTHRHSNWIFGGGHGELPTATGCNSSGHGGGAVLCQCQDNGDLTIWFDLAGAAKAE